MSKLKSIGTTHGAVKVGLGAPPKMGVSGPMASQSGTVMAPGLMAGRKMTMGTMPTMKKMKKAC